jgi:hypothetical protein
MLERNVVLSVAGALCALALAACGGGAGAAVTTTSSDGAASGADGSGGEHAARDLQRVDLDVVGEGERSALRYRFTPGLVERGRIRMGMTIHTQLGDAAGAESAAPPISMDYVIDASESLGSSLRYHFRFEQVGVEPAGAAPEVVAQLSSLLSQLERVEGHAVIDDRGRVVDSRLDVPPDLDPALASTLRSVDEMMRQMVAPLPEEPVGIGAEWKTQSLLEPSEGPRVRQISHYRLVSREQDRIVLEVSTEQVGIPGPIAVPQQGVDAHLDALSGHGHGTVTLRLDRLVALQSGSIAEVSQDATLRAEGTVIPMHMDMRMVVDGSAL